VMVNFEEFLLAQSQYGAWLAVYGLSMLVLEGQLHDAPRMQLKRLGNRWAHLASAAPASESRRLAHGRRHGRPCTRRAKRYRRTARGSSQRHPCRLARFQPAAAVPQVSKSVILIIATTFPSLNACSFVSLSQVQT